MSGRHLVILNQEANYLTTGLANAFVKVFDSVTLIVGIRHQQGEALDPRVRIDHINRMIERPSWKKAWSYLLALVRLWWLLMTRYRKHEVLFVSVPPMGYLLNLVVPHRFSMVIWDLYPDTFKVTGMSESHWLYRIWSWLNRRSFKKAYRIFTIGDVLAEAISRYIARDKIIVHPIWSMHSTQLVIPREQNQFIAQHGLAEKFIVQYSGNIGVTHNVEIMVDIAERLKDHPNIHFQIIGRGPRLPIIAELVRQRALPNVQFLPFQSEAMFPYSVSAADLGVVILNEKVSRGSVPSKAYNLMSFGVPCLYISALDSQLSRDAQQYQHARCFSSTQIDEIADFILEFAGSADLRARMARAALATAEKYRPENAVQFVRSYLATS